MDAQHLKKFWLRTPLLSGPRRGLVLEGEDRRDAAAEDGPEVHGELEVLDGELRLTATTGEEELAVDLTLRNDRHAHEAGRHLAGKVVDVLGHDLEGVGAEVAPVRQQPLGGSRKGRQGVVLVARERLLARLELAHIDEIAELVIDDESDVGAGGGHDLRHRHSSAVGQRGEVFVAVDRDHEMPDDLRAPGPGPPSVVARGSVLGRRPAHGRPPSPRASPDCGGYRPISRHP